MFSYKRSDCAGGGWRLMKNNTCRYEQAEHFAAFMEECLQALTELGMLSEKESRGISHLFFSSSVAGQPVSACLRVLQFFGSLSC